MACFRLISTGVTIFSTWTVFRAYRDYFFEIDTRTSVSWLTIPNVDMLKTSARGQNGEHSAEDAEAAGGARHGVVVVVARNHARRRSRAGSKSRVAAKHCNARAVLGSTKRNHVLADVAADNLTMLGTAVGQDVLDEIVSELVTGNCTKVSYRT
jgi:hypothetical protein